VLAYRGRCQPPSYFFSKNPRPPGPNFPEKHIGLLGKNTLRILMDFDGFWWIFLDLHQWGGRGGSEPARVGSKWVQMVFGHFLHVVVQNGAAYLIFQRVRTGRKFMKHHARGLPRPAKTMEILGFRRILVDFRQWGGSGGSEPARMGSKWVQIVFRHILHSCGAKWCSVHGFLCRHTGPDRSENHENPCR